MFTTALEVGHLRRNAPRLLPYERNVRLATGFRGNQKNLLNHEIHGSLIRANLFLLGNDGLALHTVKRTTLLATVNSEAIKRATHNVISNTGEISNTTAAHKHDRMLLKIVAFATDICSNFSAV